MVLARYSLPAFIQDFPVNSPEYRDLASRWNVNITGWIAQAMPGSPSYFYDPLATDIPSGTLAAPVQWNAFPGRLLQYFSDSTPVPPSNPYNLTQDQIYSLADTGNYTDQNGQQQSFPQIPSVICPNADWQGSLKAFGPYGPRGWLDEYCEWSSARDANNNLLRVDFACENPEYWNTLWKVSPTQVAALYQNTLNAGALASRAVMVSVADLQLYDINGNVVIDPDTGRPAYNPLNKWNSGPVAVRTGASSAFSGGAMHLTSTPNTLQTELGLAGAATVQYQPPGGSGNSDAQALICCGNYGQEYRHSDPHIGQAVNQVVADGAQEGGPPQYVCLADPVGLYIQQPDNGVFQFGPNIVVGRDVPVGASPFEVWQVIRGAVNLQDPVTGSDFQGNFVLHAVCQIPASWLAMNPNLTLADMLVGGQAIVWAGQIAAQFDIGLFARPLQALQAPPPAGCVIPGSPAGQPLQCMYAALWDGYYPQNEPCPTGTKMSLASNTTFIAPRLPATNVQQQLVLTCATVPTAPTVQVLLADGSGPDPSIQVMVTKMANVVYAVPGNSFPSPCTALYITVTIPVQRAGGLRGVQISGNGIPGGQLPAALYIVPGL